MAVRSLVLLAVGVLVLVAIYGQSESRPAYDSNRTENSNYLRHRNIKHRREDNACEQQQGDVRALCQRCAKATKSHVVYPACCDKRTNVREWCELYLNFGISK